MTKSLLIAILAALIFIPHLAQAQNAPPEARALSPKEISAFNTFHLKLFPNDGVIAPEFSATRAHGDKKWTVKASVPVLPERGYKNLCKQDQYRYRFDQHNVWEIDASKPIQQYVWLDTGSDCSKPAKHIALNVPLPDVEVIELLSKGDAVVKQAVVMLRGNTECSLVHVGSLTLTAIGTGVIHHETMLEFDYTGNLQDRASLLVRKLGAELTTWDIHCPTP
jgi:hypothetical protein